MLFDFMKFLKKYIRRSLMIFISIYLKLKYSVTVSNKCIIYPNTHFEGNNKIGDCTAIPNTKIGYGTFIGTNCNLSGAEIGRFCSIGDDVKVVVETHPSNTFVSTHPAFFSNLKQSGFSFVNSKKFDEFIYYNSQTKQSIKIGNDVWIGTQVIIMGGIEIGDGAIIAAGAVVTKNVLPYTIVGGIPAKFIKYRFNELEIDFLTDFKWWDKPISWIKSNADYFHDVKYFIEKFCK